MTVSVREQLQQRADPRAPSPTRSAATPSIAAPLDLLGAPPDREVVFLSPAARALSSAEAASIAMFPPPEPGPSAGSRFDARA